MTRILRDAYDRKVDACEIRPAPTWETVERDRLLEAHFQLLILGKPFTAARGGRTVARPTAEKRR